MNNPRANVSPANAPADPSLGPSISDFEALKFDPEGFDHSAHMYVAWSYLKDHDLATTSMRYRATLKRLTRKLGVPEKYHETVTWFYLTIIAERMECQKQVDWQAFVARNADLFARNPSLIRKFYADDVLASERARRSFVLPQPQG